MSDALSTAFPKIGERLQKLAIADLPTPATKHGVSLAGGTFRVLVKRDDVTSDLYGGNKVRKLEYLLQRARDRHARRIATFGAAGSNHALATAVHATRLGFDCTCFLSQQKATPNVARTLNMHRELGTEIVRWQRGPAQLALFRRYLQHRDAWVIPLGGTCWLGAVGFVNAGLELARQVHDGVIGCPARIYVAAGTTGSVAGLALGIAAAGLDTQIQAIRVADEPFGGPALMERIVRKTASLLRRLDPAFVTAGAALARLDWRDEFFAGGYAAVDDRTRAACATAESELGLHLETTYTGKAMAAMLHDLQRQEYAGDAYLFWNTYNSRPLPVGGERPPSLGTIPESFAHYFD